MNAPFAAYSSAGYFGRPEGDELLLAPSLERRRLECYVALMVTDLAAVLLGFAVAGSFFQGWAGLGVARLLAPAVLPIFLIIGLFNSCYSIDSLRKSSLGIVRTQVALLATAATVVLMTFYLNSRLAFSRTDFTLSFAAASVILFFSRQQLRHFVNLRCGPSVINRLVIDDGGPTVRIPGSIHVSARVLNLEPDLADPHAMDRVGLVLRNIDRVIVSCPRERRAAWAMMLKGTNVEGEVLDDEVAQLGAQGARVVDGHGMLLVSVGPLGMRARAAKRIFDLAFAGTALLLAAPLLLAVALAIKAEDRGPVFFMQRRMGRGNRFFQIYKFRSMTVAQSDRDGVVSASRTDQRITRIGRFIRKTSIDELPQLINVLKGDMSLVGPRPHAIGSQAGSKLFWEVDLRYWQRHCLKPGLSGLAQVRGFRGATECEMDLVQRLQSDLEYLEGWTILRDVKIILLTLRVLVHDRAF
jgi:lipopolysaccharide/colanic/teichoic acid biosynthesis glycosyltransferase